MRTRDKFVNLPAADIINHRSGNKTIDPIYKIPEDKITEDCIAAVAEQLGISKGVVREIHNFQWAKVKEGTDTFRTIHVSKFFKLRLSQFKVPMYIDEIKEEIAYIEGRLEESLRPTKRKELQEKKKVLEEKIEVLNVQLAKCVQRKQKNI